MRCSSIKSTIGNRDAVGIVVGERLAADAGGVARCVMAARLDIHRSQLMAGCGIGCSGGAEPPCIPQQTSPHQGALPSLCLPNLAGYALAHIQLGNSRSGRSCFATVSSLVISVSPRLVNSSPRFSRFPGRMSSGPLLVLALVFHPAHILCDPDSRPSARNESYPDKHIQQPESE